MIHQTLSPAHTQKKKAVWLRETNVHNIQSDYSLGTDTYAYFISNIYILPHTSVGDLTLGFMIVDINSS